MISPRDCLTPFEWEKTIPKSTGVKIEPFFTSTPKIQPFYDGLNTPVVNSAEQNDSDKDKNDSVKSDSVVFS